MIAESLVLTYKKDIPITEGISWGYIAAKLALQGASSHLLYVDALCFGYTQSNTIALRTCVSMDTYATGPYQNLSHQIFYKITSWRQDAPANNM